MFHVLQLNSAGAGRVVVTVTGTGGDPENSDAGPEHDPRPQQVSVDRRDTGNVRAADYAMGASRTPAASAAVLSSWSQTAKSVSAAPTASRLARCTASAPRMACLLARSPAWAVMVSVSSTGLVAAQKSSHITWARLCSAGSRRCARPAVASAARTSGYARRLDTAASQPSQSMAATSLPSSSTTSLTKALLSKYTMVIGLSAAARSPAPTPGRSHVPSPRHEQRADHHGAACSVPHSR